MKLNVQNSYKLYIIPLIYNFPHNYNLKEISYKIKMDSSDSYNSIIEYINSLENTEILSDFSSINLKQIDKTDRKGFELAFVIKSLAKFRLRELKSCH